MATSSKRAAAAVAGSHDLLLPGLPNHLALLCLSRLHPSILYNVCRSWRRLIYSPSFPPFFSLYALLSSTSSSSFRSPILTGNQAQTKAQAQVNFIEFFSFDPMASTWRPLPTPPSDPPLHLLYRHSSFISRKFPVQSLTVSGRLVLIAASTHSFLPALPRPLVFEPLSGQWSFGHPLPTPRRWCSAASVDGAVYIASGVGSDYQRDVARSLEKWDTKKWNITEWKWDKMADFKDSRFRGEATEAVGFRGKINMVNVKGKAAKEGAVYDIGSNQWEDKMPEGMLGGWNGPMAVAEDEEVMYVVDEAEGVLSKYDWVNDRWEEVAEWAEQLKGAEQMAAGRGRVCAVCGGGERIAVVDVVTRPTRMWVVNPPPGMEVVAVHVLPRMIQLEF